MAERVIEAQDIGDLIHKAPIPDKWKHEVLPLFLSYHDFKRILAWHELYQHILGVHGEIFQFGVGYGRDLNILACLRHWLEPHMPRKVVGFDTFEGIDGEEIKESIDGPKAEDGYYGFPVGKKAYIGFLTQLLKHHRKHHPSADNNPFDLMVGKAQDKLPEYLDRYSGAIALAFFDMLVYEPTKECLEMIRDRLPSGAVVAFNQFFTPGWTGESRAVLDTFGLAGLKLRQSKYHRYWAYFIVD